MTQSEFMHLQHQHEEVLEKIRLFAHQLHEDVNQTYDKVYPYGYHLDKVADAVQKYGHEVCAEDADMLPLFFGVYFHDSIEDARLSYNDVTKIARTFMDEQQAYKAAEIVYALTNDKGRTRAERAGEKYYQGIRETPYAPFCKLADRLANITHSFQALNDDNRHMKAVYHDELPHFLDSLRVSTADIRFLLPQAMIEEIYSLVGEE